MRRLTPTARLRRLLLAIGFSAVLAADAHATIVPAVGLDEMIGDAELIVRATVAEIEPRWSDDRSTIYTYVTFSNVSVIHGQLYGPLTLRFEGGAIGKYRLEVDGMPAFRIGGEEILFVRGNGVSVSPVVGLFQGRFQVVEGRVYDHAGAPLVGIADGTLIKLVDDPPAAVSGGASIGTPDQAEYEYKENPDRERIEAALVAADAGQGRYPAFARGKGTGIARNGSHDEAVVSPPSAASQATSDVFAPKPAALYVTRSEDKGQRLTASAFIAVVRARLAQATKKGVQ